MDNSPTISDIAAVTKGGGTDGAGWVVLILLFAMIYGGWGGGRQQGPGDAATSAEVQRGFDSLASSGSQRDILTAVTSGTSQAVAATNSTFHDVWSMVSDKYSELQRDVAGVALQASQNQSSQQECCGQVLRAIDGLKHAIAREAADTRAHATSEAQSVKDLISHNRESDMQQRISQLELQNAMAGVIRYPTQTAYTSGANPFCGCGCQQG